MAELTQDVLDWIGGLTEKLGIPDAAPATKHEPELPKDDDKAYKYKEFIAEVFERGKGDENKIDPNDVAQGHLGDCYFLAAVAAVARANPKSLEKLIAGPKKDGSYDVTLYVDKGWFSYQSKPKVINVKPVFATDKKGNPAYAGKGDKELWVMLLEKAYAKLNGGYDDLDKGGRAEDAMEALTGKDATWFKVSSKSKTEILDIFKDALDKKDPEPVVANSHSHKDHSKEKKKTNQKYGIVGPHAYPVRAVNGKIIDLQNPWGTDHVKIPIDDFMIFFNDVSIEKK